MAHEPYKKMRYFFNTLSKRHNSTTTQPTYVYGMNELRDTYKWRD